MELLSFRESIAVCRALVKQFLLYSLQFRGSSFTSQCFNNMADIKESQKKFKKYSRIFPETDDDEIVISGMAGKFPNSRNVEDYKYNLYNKIDMVDDDERRWRHFNPEIPKRSGKIYELNKFDATFFGIHFKQAHTMDPQTRMIIETAYEAVIDAGINPKSLRGSRTGVYVGSCISESEKTWFYERVPSGGFGITGCSRAMLANRISYSLGLEGPSFLLDTACSSSMYALDNAFTALRNGEIDAAIIGGANLILHPFVTLQFARLGVLAQDGYCRPFDKNANGYTRSEAINCLFLQRKRDAKRIYGSVIHSKTNCDGYKPEGITYPSGKLQEKLLREFYSEVDVTPNELGYVEAHSTGTVVGDPEECRAIDNVICQQRSEPLLVGSVKSNIGHSEPASGICSLIKVCLAFETGKVPPNINFEEIKAEIPALAEGRLKVVSEVTELKKPYIGVSSFGFGGANAHALLKAFDKDKKNQGLPDDDIPRLVTWGGRTLESVNAIFDDIETRPLDAEYIALLHNIQKEDVPGMVFRAFGIFSKNDNQNAQSLVRDAQHFTGIKRPTVWVFSGMGSQWTEMGASLMVIPRFRQSIEECHEVLKTKGLDLIEILTSTNQAIFDNILHSFVGIAAVQIGLVDTLRSLNLEPDYIIGHSVGELGCGYADGGFTREQMILAAYYRGKVSLEIEKIKGSMAAIGLGYKKIVSILPQSIEVACHNGADSCTISGPTEDIAKFVEHLKSKDIFAKEVPCSNIAYHSRYIAHMGPHLLKYLKEIIPNPKLRSDRWLSTSVPKSAWDQLDSRYCSAEYHTNNLLSSVLFEETFVLLPNNALTIEIAPHGLLQAILKRSMPGGVHIPLTQRQNSNNSIFFLTALGKLYNNGITIPVDNLYPKVEFPVSRGTAGISSLVRWDHTEDWFVTKYENMKTKASGERLFKVNLTGDDEEFIRGHIIDGKILVPATSYLQYVWQTFSLMYHGPSFMDVPVEFEDVRFLRATNMSINANVELNVMIHYGTGNFEITESGALVVTGRIREIEHPEVPVAPEFVENLKFPMLNKRDFYKELKLRGYHYNGAFKPVETARGDGLFGQIKWDYNWVTFMDAMLQIQILGVDSRQLCVPTKLKSLKIYGKHHFDLLTRMDADNRVFDVYVDKDFDRIVSGGIEMVGMQASPVQRRKPPGMPVLEYYRFVPHNPTPSLQVSDAIRFCVHLALENQPVVKLKIAEMCNNKEQQTITYFKDAIEDLPLITGDYLYLTNEEFEGFPGVTIENSTISNQTNCYFVIVNETLSEQSSQRLELNGVEQSIIEGGWLAIKQSKKDNAHELSIPQFKLIAIVPIANLDETILLYRKDLKNPNVATAIIQIDENDDEFTWIASVQQALENKTPSIIYAEKENFSGIIGFMNCLRKEPNGNIFTLMLIRDKNAPPFNTNDEFYAQQLSLGLAYNMYIDGQWGSYRHLQLPVDKEIAPCSTYVFGNVIHRGDLSTLRWFDGPFDPKNCKVKVVYSSLNFRDVMLATGRLTGGLQFGISDRYNNCVLGFEYSGVDLRTGKRIMSMIEKGGVASHIDKPTKLFWEVPKEWSLEEAATVPVVYITVYYAFFMCTDIRKGKTILIHAGTGGIGLAAIRVALAYNMEVFTTCSTQKKRDFLLSTFPQLKASHIGNSRDTSFEYMIKRETNGKGVDFVLNSLSEDKLTASLRCLGLGGQFLEIGKFDIVNDSMIGMSCFMKETRFIAVFADRLFVAPEEEIRILKRLIDTDIANGIIKPLPATVFPASEIEQAFRHLIGGKHIGKVLIQVRDSPESIATQPIKVEKQIYFKPDRSYIICGGLGGFGLELVDWMMKRGAQKFVLSSSRGISKSYQQYRIALLRSYGCDVLVNTSDIATLEGCQKLLEEAQKLAPIGGIFNLAVVLRDGIFANQTTDKFKESFAPKAFATKFLDQLSRKLSPALDHFVVFSSVSCGRGNAGQTNYGMANSIMERIIEDRHKNGLAGKAIQWGAIGEVGLVADLAEDKIDMEIGGTLQQRLSSCLYELDTLFSVSHPLVASMVVAEKRLGRSGNESIIETVMNIMGIRDLKSISLGTSLSEMGMDSLMAVEIKQTLERDFELVLTPQELRGLTFQKIQEYEEAQKREIKDTNRPMFTISKVNGMELLLRNLGDEKCSNEDIIALKSNNPVETNINPIIVIPGIEGTAGQAWYNLGSNVNYKMFVMQLHKFAELEHIDEIAESAYEILKVKLKPTLPFYLVGYSYGTFVAIRLAEILEKSGYSGRLALIDGAPHFLKQLTIAHLGEKFTDNDFYNLVFCSIVNQIFPEETPEKLYQVFSAQLTYDDKIAKFKEYVKRQSIYSEQYAETIVRAMLKRTRMACTYDLERKHELTSPILLIRPNEVSMQDIEPDYCLSQITTGKVTLKVIDGNHTTMLANPTLPDIINAYYPRLEDDASFEKYISNIK